MSQENLSPWSAGERKLLEEAIVPSPHSVDLERTPLGEFLHRLANPNPNVAELFHENSKLSPVSTLTVPAGERKLAEAREWFFTTAYALREEEVEPHAAHLFRLPFDDLPPLASRLLEPFTVAGPMTDRLYGVDLLLLHGGRLLRLLPRRRLLWVEREMSVEETAWLKAAILELPRSRVASWSTWLFLVGCPWRYMLLYGPRGYRHTLFDAGRLLGFLEERARQQQIDLAVAQNFYDNRIDRLLYTDGVERSTLAVLGISGGER